MAASTTVRTKTEYIGALPSLGTLPVAADTLILKGTMVAQDASGRAVEPTDGDGFPIMGVASHTLNNQVGSELGGLADAEKVQIDYGVFTFAFDGATPKKGDLVYSVDNQTVSIDSDTDARGFAGIVTEYYAATNQVAVWISPCCNFAGDATDFATLEADAVSASHSKSIPLASLHLSTGAVVPAFSDGVADGFSLVDSEAFGLRINNGSTTVFVATLESPPDLDDTEDIVLHLRGFRVGASDTTAAVTVGAFFQVNGAAHTADANAGSASTAFDGATTVVTDETVTIAAADVPAGPWTLTLTFQVTAALDADDLVLLGLSAQYTGKLLT
jgi:hypothetical protein